MKYRSVIFANYRNIQCLSGTADLRAMDDWGRAYDTYMRGWLPANLDAAIADIGCGSGGLLRYFIKRNYRNVAGVDISAEQLAVARQVCENVYLENATEFLRARRGAFDLITSFDLVEHLRKDELLDFLTAAQAALRPGGRIILQTPNCASPFGVVLRYADFTHELGLTPNALVWLLRLSGFERSEAREQGPFAHGVKSATRCLLWKLIRTGFLILDLVETGASCGIYTRVFIVSAIKPPTENRNNV